MLNAQFSILAVNLEGFSSNLQGLINASNTLDVSYGTLFNILASHNSTPTFNQLKAVANKPCIIKHTNTTNHKIVSTLTLTTYYNCC